MRTGIAALITGAMLCLSTAALADDLKDKRKDAEEAQAKADKAQAKADKETAEYNAKYYKEYIKAQKKTYKEWSKLDTGEREEYFIWVKKNKH